MRSINLMNRDLALSPVRATVQSSFLHRPDRRFSHLRLRKPLPLDEKAAKLAASGRSDPPLRVFHKFKAPFSMKKFAPRTTYLWHHNIKSSSKETSERHLESNFGNILSLLAYEGYLFEDVCTAAEMTFPFIRDLSWLVDYVCDVHVKPFVCIFEKQILNLINKLVSPGSEGDHGVVFKPFNKNIKAYKRVIEEVYQQYKHLENVSMQVEKLIKHYLQFSKQSEDSLSMHIQKQLFYSWQFNSDVFTMLISNLHNYFQRGNFLSIFSSLEETISKVAQIHFALDQSGLNSAEIQESMSPTRTSMQVLNTSIAKQESSVQEKIKELTNEEPIITKKKRNKKKAKETQRAKENIDRLFETELKYLPVRALNLMRAKAQIQFNSEERLKMIDHSYFI